MAFSIAGISKTNRPWFFHNVEVVSPHAGIQHDDLVLHHVRQVAPADVVGQQLAPLLQNTSTERRDW